MTVCEVRPEPTQIVATRPEVVIDDIKADSESAMVSGVDEALQGGRPTIGVVHGIQGDTVITPAPSAREGRNGQHLHHVDTEVNEVIQPADRGFEGALRREGADVHLIDDRAEYACAGAGSTPRVIAPGELREIDKAAWSVHTRWLPGAAGVG